MRISGLEAYQRAYNFVPQMPLVTVKKVMKVALCVFALFSFSEPVMRAMDLEPVKEFPGRFAIKGMGRSVVCVIGPRPPALGECESFSQECLNRVMDEDPKNEDMILSGNLGVVHCAPSPSGIALVTVDRSVPVFCERHEKAVEAMKEGFVEKESFFVQSDQDIKAFFDEIYSIYAGKKEHAGPEMVEFARYVRGLNSKVYGGYLDQDWAVALAHERFTKIQPEAWVDNDVRRNFLSLFERALQAFWDVEPVIFRTEPNPSDNATEYANYLQEIRRGGWIVPTNRVEIPVEDPYDYFDHWDRAAY